MSTIALGSRVVPFVDAAGPRQGRAARGSVSGGVASPGRVRLTRRGRVVVTLVFVALILIAFAAVGARTAATPEPGAPVATVTVVVQPGDTLWQIASQYAPSQDMRDAVRLIEELNGLSDASIVVGQKLYVPAAS